MLLFPRFYIWALRRLTPDPERLRYRLWWLSYATERYWAPGKMVWLSNITARSWRWAKARCTISCIRSMRYCWKANRSGRITQRVDMKDRSLRSLVENLKANHGHYLLGELSCMSMLTKWSTSARSKPIIRCFGTATRSNCITSGPRICASNWIWRRSVAENRLAPPYLHAIRIRRL